jgi:muconate cycloisomerase
MLLKSIEFVELELPFKREFSHARKTRTGAGTILVRVITTQGVVGWGEILPRSYVTGETSDALFDDQAHRSVVATLAHAILDCRFHNQQTLTRWIDDQLPSYRYHTALFGGVELALWSALHQTSGVDFDRLIGPVNPRKPGRCLTIGFETDKTFFRQQAIAASVSSATVVKLKVGRSDDIERLLALDGHLNGKLPIRVDANGMYSVEQTRALLEACAHKTALQSIEEPFARHSADGEEAQRTLYAQYGIPFVADESVCSMDDARKANESGCFQIINLRMGKHGGMQAAVRLRDFADQQNLGLVCGSMVGETGVLSQASELLLARSTQFDYVEGLGQNNHFLQIDPVQRVDDSSPLSPFIFKEAQCSHLVRRTMMFE